MGNWKLDIPWTLIEPEDPAGSDMVDVENVERKWLDVPYGQDSPSQVLDVYLPPEGSGPFPVYIFLHGGAFIAGDKRDVQFLLAADGIRRGYGVVSVEYRRGFERKAPCALFDVKAAIRFLRGNAEKYCLDKSRFAVGGDSAGSYFAAILGTSAGIPALEDPGMGYPDEDTSVQAVIGLFGVYDLEKQSRFTEDAPAAPGGAKMGNFADIFLGLNCREYPDIARLAWPGSYVRPDCPPFLIQAGTSDEVVPYENSPDLANRINAVCGEGRAILQPMEGCTHGHPDYATPENKERLFAFLDSVLK